jgi:hypothetical protein
LAKKRLAVGNQNQATQGAGSRRGAADDEDLRREMAVNADRSSEDVNEKGKNSRRTGSSPRNFLKGWGRQRSTRTAGTITGARRTE